MISASMSQIRRSKKQIKEQLKKVEESNLTTEEKEKVFKAYKDVNKFSVTFAIGLAILLTATMVIEMLILALCVIFNPECGPELIILLVLLGSIPTTIIIIVACVLAVVVPMNKMKEAREIMKKMDNDLAPSK